MSSTAQIFSKPIESYPDFINATSDSVSIELKLNKVLCREITFQVTEDCNLRCTYCYQTNKTPFNMSFEIAKAFIDDLLSGGEKLSNYIDLDTTEAYVFDFIGGEPLLRIDLIDQIMDYWVKQVYIKEYEAGKRFMISMSSNGTLYNTDKVQKFIKKWSNHLSIGVTVDGNKTLHDACRLFPDGKGSYDLAYSAAMDLLHNYGQEGTKLTFAPSNIKYVCDAVMNMVNSGFTDIHANCVFEEGWKIEDAKIFYDQLKLLSDKLLQLKPIPYVSLFDDYIGKPMDETDNNNWCGGTGAMLGIDPKGNYYPCVRYMPSSMPCGVEPYAIGDLENGIGNLDVHKKRCEELACITRRSQSTDECFNCPIASGCAWCSGYNYTVFGTPNKRATFICDMHKARVLANVYFWNKLFRKYGIDETFQLNLEFENQQIIDKEEYEMLEGLVN